jgi:uncharacterized protein (TIGR00369 family)
MSIWFQRPHAAALNALHRATAVAALGIAAAIACVDGSSAYCVGPDVNASHLRGVRDGLVTGTARPIRVGRTSHVWAIEIRDRLGQLVSVARLTVAVLPHREN